MKIEAIRGAGLASLDAPFEIELARAPLGDAGVFLISGPTGAGKSTLLDALCLALFDRVPRLPERKRTRGASVDDGASLNTHVSSLLRSDAGEGHAEVDFQGIDGLHYRARWQIRRARKRPTGRLQKQELSLHELDTGARIGDKRTEVLEEIERRVGFDFQHFVRAVLLPQGGFAAFLHADANERASMLERLTGTEIYSWLSIRAFEAFKERDREVKRLEEDLGSRATLDPDARRQLDEGIDRRREELEASETERRRLAVVLEWHRRAAELSLAFDDAKRRVEEDERRAQEMATDRERLAGFDQVADLRGASEAREQRSKTLAQRATELKELDGLMAAALDAAEGAKVTLNSAAAANAEHAQTVAAFEPTLQAARALVAELATLEKRRAEAQQALDRTEERLRRVEERVATLDARKGEITAELQSIRDWLTDPQRAHLAPLAQGWPVTEERLLRLLHDESALRKLHETLSQTTTQTQTLRERIEVVSHSLIESQTTASELERAVKDSQERAAAIHERDWYREIDAISAREREIEQWRSLSARATEYLRRLDAGKRERARLHGELEGCRAQLRIDIEPLVASFRNDRKEARRHLENTRAALSFAEERGLLRDGQPCPLCGSPHHPWRDGAPALEEGALSRAVESIEAKLDVLEERRRAVEAALARTQGRLEDLDSRIEAESEEVKRIKRALPEGTAREHLDDVAHELRSRREALKTEQQAFEAALRERERCLEARRDHERREEKLVRELESTRAALEGSLENQTQAIEAARELEVTLAASAQALAKIAVELDAATIRREPEQARRQLAKRVEVFDEMQKRLAALDAELRGQASERAGTEGERSGLEGPLRELRASARELENELERARRERQGLLDGKLVREVVEELTRQSRETARAVERAQAAVAQRENELSTLKGRREASEAEWARLSDAHRKANEWLAHELEGRELTLTALADRLAFASEAGATRVKLRELDERLSAARTSLELRRKDLAAQRREPPTLDLDGARAQELELRERVEALRAAQIEALATQKRDDERRRESSALSRKLESAAEARRLAEQLKELIGSADGREFRRFAQAITLEHLVVHANKHLASLANRYSIVASTDSSLTLQVIDREMGDQVRSVHSLSGGETFLVSLALSLGLAGLHTRTQARSLFIDEGFGALDPESLEVALSALDALQAGGRQVAVISHVEALRDRFAAEVRVLPEGEGRSRVIVAG